MKVYVVSGYNWDWKYNLSPRVFLNKEDAMDYYNKVKDKMFDVYDVFETKLETETELKNEDI